MAIQQSDIMDFGNGIIGDDTFDVWRKKTNGLRREIDTVNASLTAKINTDIANLSSVYVPISGTSTSVSTPLQFTSAATFTQSISVGNSILTGLSNKLSVDTEIESAIQLTSNKVKAGSQLILGTKTYTVPSAPAINNAVLTSATTNGDLAWQNAATLFANSGGLQQTTTVFEEVMPVGSIIALGGLTSDTNYLLCEGAFVSKDGEYSDLFDVIGYRYGGSASGTDTNGNPFTDFQLPDYRGRVAVGTDSAGGFNAGALGNYGGDATTTSTSNSILGIQHIPAHRHRFVDNAGNNLFAIADDNRGTLAGNTGGARNTLGSDAIDMQGPNEVNSSGNSQDTAINFTTYTGGGANGSIHGGTTAEDDLSSLSGTTGHSHSITTANRVQPYIAIKYYIKAKQNTKIDFKIDIASSGLVSTTSAGVPQTLISVSNETHSLSVNPDNTSIALDNNFKVSVKSSPTIQGTITATGNVISEEPTVSNHLTTKNYVDTRSDGIRTVSIETDFGTIATQNSIAHNLGGTPSIVQYYLKFLANPVGGYAVGEHVLLSEGTTWSGTIGHFGRSVDATNFYWGYGAVGHTVTYIATSTGNYQGLYLQNNTDYKLIIKAIRFI